MTTQDYHRLLTVCRSEGYRLALVGDPLQLSAVGRGGMMNHACEIAPTVELEKVHRFREALGGRGLARAAQGKARGRSPSTSATGASTRATKKTSTRGCSRTGGTLTARARPTPSRSRRERRPTTSPRSRKQRRIEAGELDTSRHFVHQARPAHPRRRHRADAPQRAPALARAGRPRAKPRGLDRHRDRTRRLGHAQAHGQRAHPSRPRRLCARADRARLLLDRPRGAGPHRAARRHADRRARRLSLLLRRHDARARR